MRKTATKLAAVRVNGRGLYCVQWPKVGIGRNRRFFKIKAEATTFLEQKRVEQENLGTRGMSFTERQRSEYLECCEMLDPFGVSLRNAIAIALPHLRAKKRSCGLGDLVDELLRAKVADGASDRYLKDLRTRLNIFRSAFPQALVSDFSTATIDDWLRSLPHSAVTRNNYRRLLNVLFNFAVQRGYAADNPVTESSRAKQIDKPPGILRVDEAVRLLHAADAEILPAIVLGLFAGLRPESEVWRLDWDRIDFESELIDVAADKTKTAQKRFVKMQENLIEWLLPWRKSGPVSPTGDKYNSLLRRARKAAGIDHWPADCLRHTFASMHFAQFKNAAETAQELGHADLKMLYRHYRERVRPKEAERYWNIRPARVRNVVAMTSVKVGKTGTPRG